jgi:tRNA A37 threonylcarbamoyladenosine biosynthesis protein TsaE
MKFNTIPPPLRGVRRYAKSELQDLALQLAPLLKPGTRLFLEGPPGVGKSTWAKTLLRCLIVDDVPYQGSPSFGWIHSYSLLDQTWIHHIDLDRLKSMDQWFGLGLESYLLPEARVWIEWSSRWPDIQKRIIESGLTFELRIAPVDDQTRDWTLFERTSHSID